MTAKHPRIVLAHAKRQGENGLCTLFTSTNEPTPIIAAAKVLDIAREGCSCSECRPLVEDAGQGLRLVR